LIFSLKQFAGTEMPNWCGCSIRIQGPEENMQEFYKTLSKPNECGETVVFSFHQTVPSAVTENSYTSNDRLILYEHPNITNWGTKWDAHDPVIVIKEPTDFLLQCDTAWSPPLKWGKKVTKMFPKLTFTISYCECGLQFYGMWCCNTEKQVTKTKEYNFLPDDTIGYRIREDGTKVVDNENADEIQPNGRLKAFMEKYSIRNMGG
jgi:hypothetical protein